MLRGVRRLQIDRQVDLDRRVAVTPEEPGQADPVGTAALDSEHVDPAERQGPGKEFRVAVVGDRDLLVLWVSTPTMTAPRSSAMLAMVVVPFPGSMVEAAGRAGRTGLLRWDLVGSGSYEVTARSAGGALRRRPG
jgi:hypothetical protein